MIKNRPDRRFPAVVPLVLCLVALLIACIAPSSAAAGQYDVVQCDRSNREFADARFDRVNGGDYGFLYRCEEDEDATRCRSARSPARRRDATGGSHGRRRRGRGSLPPTSRRVSATMRATRRGSRSSATAVRRSADRDRPRRRDRLRALTAASSATAAAPASPRRSPAMPGAAARQAIAPRPGCDRSDLTIDDRRAPAPVAGRSLSSPGWHRGVGTLGAVASDEGSGVRRFEVIVNGRDCRRREPSPAT